MSSLSKFFSKDYLYAGNYEKYLKLKEKFLKEGLPENIATYKATSFLTPEKLEKINLIPENKTREQPIEFYFDSKEDMELVCKYFKVSMVNMQVGNSKLLIELLKLLDQEESISTGDKTCQNA